VTVNVFSLAESDATETMEVL